VAATVHYLRSHFKTKIFFAMIVHNTEQHRSFVSMLPPSESHITPGGWFIPTSEITVLCTFDSGYNAYIATSPIATLFVDPCRIFCSFITTVASFLYSLSASSAMWSHHTNLVWPNTNVTIQ